MDALVPMIEADLVDATAKLVTAVGVIVLAVLAYRSRTQLATVAQQTATVAVQTAEIHGLVNSSYTAALRAELDATLRELAMMREVISIKLAAGGYPEPGPDTLAAMEAAKLRIAKLQLDLDERTRLAAAAAVAGAPTPPPTPVTAPH